MYVLPLAAATLLVTTTTTVDAYTSNMYGGRNRCNPSSNFANSKRAERYQQRQRRVDDAFRELQNEMNESFNNGPRRRRRGDRFDRSSPSSRTSPFSGPQMFMMDVPPGAFYQEVDKDQMKKWIGKAFNLASEWNDDFAPSDLDKEANMEFLEKSKEWVDRLYDAQEEVSQERTTVKDPASSQKKKEEFSNPETTNEWYDMAKNPNSPVGKKKNADPETSEGADESSPASTKPETPYSENRSDDTMFQVAVDLPGVEREDIDISFKGDFLTIEAERRPTLTDDEGEEESRQQRVGQGRKFMKRFVLIEDEVEIDQIDASLKNGILMVSAPKKAKVEEEEQEEPPRKININ
mmetsp:Transcript_54296/g.131734  ORF Transcript_54296/g.131734 Transcript_54296/m.131734 type:complete len:350 (+) Transcript_54296:444-1493(+)|eukprot:CAMPEP_0113463800 /NCGR_PEP_ID=MMETSP0014_2-20120614/12857_1 /TAXON_ID=2857 /ORGANISM="Nitzschia sp." /LENGTH=349 /DNA_ID=CAMNT_0000355831 /DNA_START=402 /DNA_END=1451 /DNA_ORIENTATION=- /assembly_acc=CAM_ASM_000159